MNYYQIIILLVSILIGYNQANTYIDAYKILKDKSIAHGINGGVYFVIIGLCIWLSHLDFTQGSVFFFSAFFNRQITFDIPLNLTRGLAWNYQSVSSTAILDKIENYIFGAGNGTLIAITYGTLFIALTTTLFFI